MNRLFPEGALVLVDPDAPAVRVIGRAVSYTAPDGWRA